MFSPARVGRGRDGHEVVELLRRVPGSGPVQARVAKDERVKIILIPLALVVIIIGIFPNIFIEPMRLPLELIISNYELANGK